MEIQFFAQKMDLTPRVREYVMVKIKKIIKQAGYSTGDIRGVHVDLSRNMSHKAEERIRLEINIDFLTGQRVVRAAERAESVQKAADLIEEELKKQLSKLKHAKKDKDMKGVRAMKEKLASLQFSDEE